MTEPKKPAKTAVVAKVSKDNNGGNGRLPPSLSGYISAQRWRGMKRGEV